MCFGRPTWKTVDDNLANRHAVFDQLSNALQFFDLVDGKCAVTIAMAFRRWLAVAFFPDADDAGGKATSGSGVVDADLIGRVHGFLSVDDLNVL